MWNHARGESYTDLPNPCEGIKGFSLAKRTGYITDAVFAAVYKHAASRCAMLWTLPTLPASGLQTRCA